MTRGVGDHECLCRRCEIAVGDIDRDALIALGAQAIGEKGKVKLTTAPLTCQLDRGQLIVEDTPGVDQQAADERALAVINGADRRKAQESTAARSRGRDQK